MVVGGTDRLSVVQSPVPSSDGHVIMKNRMEIPIKVKCTECIFPSNFKDLKAAYR
jgi:hypothetical protein